MCNTCLSSSLSGQESFVENNDGGKCENFPPDPLEHLFKTRWQWLSRPLTSFMGQGVSKQLNGTEILLVKKSWKFVRHPWLVRSVIVFLALFYVGVPLAFYACPWVRRGAVFLHFADWPFQNFSSPEAYGLKRTRHFFVETTPGVRLGVWHVCSATSDLLADDSRPVVLYLHGSAESRSAAYRRSMYRVLSRPPIDAHVITFDYRGFGDSTYVSPTAKSLEEDAAAMYEWLRKRVPRSRIILWGHSMGTGLAVRLGARQNQTRPQAIVLEAPFTSVADATHTFPLSFFHRRLPLFRRFCSDRTRHPDTHLDSEELVGRLTAPLLILHAADDSMVWSEQGKRLWTRALTERSQHLHTPVFVELDGKYGCGHRNIHKAPNLPDVVHKFLEDVKNSR